MLDARPYSVLIVEDDTNHVMLIRLAFARADASARISATQSAEEAIAYLRGSWPDTDFGRSEVPDVIVLDINMPGMGGLGFLEWYNGESKIADIPVVVFTSSADPDLVRRCFALGAMEFMAKPLDFGELVPVVQRVLDGCRPDEVQSPG